VLANSLVTVLSPLFVTQMLVPSKATAFGSLPTEYVPTTAPVLANSLVTVLALKFVTQMLIPSKAAPASPLLLLPLEKVPTTAPLLANSSTTAWLFPVIVTQTFVPSKATRPGVPPTE